LGRTLSSPKAPIPWTEEVLGYKNAVAGRGVIPQVWNQQKYLWVFSNSKESEEIRPFMVF
jgi:hypothetical protein